MCTLLTQNICLMCHTQWLDLGGNQIGDAGLTALAKVVGSGALASLLQLSLISNLIGDAGLSALASACASGALAQLTVLGLSRNQIGDAGLSSLAVAVGNGALDHLTVYWRPTALSPCLETPHAHSPDSEHLFDVPYAGAFTVLLAHHRQRLLKKKKKMMRISSPSITLGPLLFQMVSP